MLQTHLDSLLCGFKAPVAHACNPRLAAFQMLHLHLFLAVELRKLGFEVRINKGDDLLRCLRGHKTGKVNSTSYGHKHKCND